MDQTTEELRELVALQVRTIEEMQIRMGRLIAEKADAEARCMELAQTYVAEVAAPAAPVVTVDTPEFHAAYSDFTKGSFPRLITYIDAHTSAAIAQARAAALAELHPAYEAMQLRAIDAEAKLEQAAADVLALYDRQREDGNTIAALKERAEKAEKALASERSADMQTIRDRDQYHEWADKLSTSIAAYFNAEIGEHSSANCPWAQALDVIEEAAPQQHAQTLRDGVEYGACARTAAMQQHAQASDPVGQHNAEAAQQKLVEHAQAALSDALRDVLAEYDRNTCPHENTKRGGAIWTICEDCGAKWADDRGGFKPYTDPEKIAAARAILASQQPVAAPDLPIVLELPEGDTRTANIFWHEVKDGKRHICISVSDVAPVAAVAQGDKHDTADRLAMWLSASMDQHAAVDEMRKHIRAWLDHQPPADAAPGDAKAELVRSGLSLMNELKKVKDEQSKKDN